MLKFKKNLYLLLIIDIVLFTISYLGSYLLRFDLRLPSNEYLNFRRTLIPIIILKIFVFYSFNLYKGIWNYTGLKDLENIIKASFVSSAFIIILILIANRFQGFARSIFFIDSILTIFLIGGFRFGIRLLFQYNKQGLLNLPWQNNKKVHKKGKKLLIIGAGDAGEKILREINDNASLNYRVIGFLDDDPGKIHCQIHGIKVLDSIEGLNFIAEHMELDEIFIAIPSASGEKMRRIVDLCRKTGVSFKTVPGIGELINGNVSVSHIREVFYSDLLGRSQVELDMERIGDYLQGKCVLVTGAGGSIGSEFCRQVARFKPKMLVMLDRAESSLYDIEMEIKYLFPGQLISPILGSTTCLDLLKKVFGQFKPQVVFHAAAYKHVPMLEMHPWEAVYNNILGTKNTLDMALESGTERFVLISTDKAVRPTNIMGASKRVAESILLARHKEMVEARAKGRSKPIKIMAVRFGNVIGSAGSVIPLFKKQIANGGPVTVTDPRITRYFMTINEAVQLVLQAGAMGESGEIYILKMGRPVRILDMARDLIRLSGFEPDKDIRIEVTGIRPGEKLYEELITEGEGIVPTSHDKLMVLRGDENRIISSGYLERKIKELVMLAKVNDSVGIKAKLKEIVPEYNAQGMKEDVAKEDGVKAGYEKAMALEPKMDVGLA